MFTIKNSIRSLGVLASLLFLNACGADAVQDTLNQEQDRQRINASKVAKDDQLLTGTYETSAALDSSSYYVIAQLELSYDQRDGTYVPQPSLSGTFRMFDKKIAKNKGINLQLVRSQDCNSNPDPSICGYLSSFSGGQFDATSGIFVTHIQGFGGVSGIAVSCKRISESELDCRWEPAAGGANGFDFILTQAK